MPFQVSPGVNVSEIDLTTIVPAVSTTEGAIAGVFRWGPIDKITLVDSEDKLWNRFGKPTNHNPETFFTSANFLSYGNRLFVSRAANTTGDDVNVTIPTGLSQGSNTFRDFSYNTANNNQFSFQSGNAVVAYVTGVSSPNSAGITAGMVVTGSAVNSSVTVSIVSVASDNKITLSHPATASATSNSLVIVGVSNTDLQSSLSPFAGETNYKIYSELFSQNTTVTSVSNAGIVFSTSALVASQNTPALVFNTTSSAVYTAVANTGYLTEALSSNIVKNEDDYLQKDGTFESDVLYVARYPGALGNSLKVSVCDSADQFNSSVNLETSGSFTNSTSGTANATTFAAVVDTVTLSVGTGNFYGTIAVTLTGNSTSTPAQGVTDTTAADIAESLADKFTVGDYIVVGNNTVGKQLLKISSFGTAQTTSNSTAAIQTGSIQVNFEDKYSLTTNFSTSTAERYWEYFSNVEGAPTQSTYVENFGNTSADDLLHVVVADENGKFTGVPGTILEVFQNVSRATDAKSQDGAALYYKTVINDNSNYVWWANDRGNAASATAAEVASSVETKPLTQMFTLGFDGSDESNVAISDLAKAYDKFKSAEDIDVSLILQGKARGASNGAQLANYIIDNICESRKDCVAFVSPDRADVVNNLNEEMDSIIQFRNSMGSSSYAVLDSGYKYQYDKYNDIYRWVPLNGDIAGLAVRTDSVRDPWWSPAGFNRGQIKNVIKLAYNPSKAERDSLYKSGINPVVAFPGQGIILFGDKTLLAKPSAFDRINVRRLFIVLEKAIATAAKFTLFEFNDEFTRAQFRNLVEPFLRDVQGRRGIYDFRVVCDETNNTGEVIDRNEFVGDIYIKPARSINFIQLNFVAVRTGVEFSEVVGKF